MSAWTVLRAQLRADRGVLALLALVLASLAALGTLLPAAVTTRLDAALRQQLQQGSLSQRQTRVLDNEAALTAADLTRLRNRAAGMLSPQAAVVLRPAADVAFTDALDVTGQAGRARTAVPAQLALRYQSGLLDQARFEAGRRPVAAASGPVQIALTASAAAELQVSVGDRFTLAPRDVPAPPASASDQAPIIQGPVEVLVTGLFTPRDASADAWAYDAQILSPGAKRDRSGDITARVGTALVNGASLDRLARDVGSLSYELYDDVDLDALRAGDALAVQQALEQAEAEVRLNPTQTPARKYAAGAGTAYLLTDADTALGAFRAQAAKARTLIALVLTGVVLLALLTAAMIAGLGASRRRSVLTLTAARGVSSRQLLTFTAALVLLIVVPAGVAGQVLGNRLAGGPVQVRLLPLVALIGAALTLALVVVVGGSGRWSRLVPGLFVMVLALSGLAVLSLRQRALPAAGTDALTGSDGQAGVDWLLMATPALLALGVGLVTAALSRWPVRWAAAWSARGRGAVAHTALSRARHGGTVATVLTTAMVAAVALTGYALAVQGTLQSAYERGGWDAVGADLRIDGTASSLTAVADVRGVAGGAAASVVEATLIAAGGQASTVRLVAVDTADYERVFAAAPQGARELGRLRAGSGLQALGSPDATSLASSGARLTLGAPDAGVPVGVRPLTADQAVLTSLGATPSASQAALRRGPGVLLVDRQRWQERTGTTLPVNRVFVAADRNAAGVLAGRPGARVSDRRTVQSGLADAPLTAGVRLAMRTSLVVAAGYAAVLLIAGLALSAPARARDVARLRTLGASGRQAAALLGWELLPLTLLSTGAGLLGVLALVVLVGPAIDLSPYTSGAAVPALHLSPAAGAALAVVAGSLAVVALLVGRRLDSRGTIGTSLRAGDT